MKHSETGVSEYEVNVESFELFGTNVLSLWGWSVLGCLMIRWLAGVPDAAMMWAILLLSGACEIRSFEKESWG